MKKLLFSAVAAAALLFVGCSKDVDHDRIIGRWEGYEMYVHGVGEDDPGTTVTYAAGSFILTIEQDELTISRNGNPEWYEYRYNENRRQISATDRSEKTQTVKVVRQNGSKLVLLRDGHEYRFRAK